MLFLPYIHIHSPPHFIYLSHIHLSSFSPLPLFFIIFTPSNTSILLSFCSHIFHPPLHLLHIIIIIVVVVLIFFIIFTYHRFHITCIYLHLFNHFHHFIYILPIYTSQHFHISLLYSCINLIIHASL